MYILNKIKGKVGFFSKHCEKVQQRFKFFFYYFNSKKCHLVRVVCAQLLSHADSVTARTAAQQSPLSMGFSRQEC